MSVTEARAPATANASSRLRRLLVARPEAFTFAMLVALCVTVAIINPAFLAPSTLVDLARASVVTGLFALGVFVILAAGGIDVSFTAVAALSMFAVTQAVVTWAPDLPITLVIAASALLGTALGLINGLLVHALRVPSLIVTIGTQYLFRGFLLAFVGTVWIMDLPQRMEAFGRAPLLAFDAASGARIVLPVYFLALPAAALVTWWVLNRTMMGRAIFAMGGNRQVAERLGFNLLSVHLFLFGFAGLLAGLAGIIHVCASRLANPSDLVGIEINVIAAVVLGGARITGGTGSVLGTMLGVLLVVVVNNVLVLVGVPSTWQRVVVGAFILVAAAFFGLGQRPRT